MFDRIVEEKKKSDTDLFLKFKDGDSYVLCCRGNDLTYDFVWNDAKNKSELVPVGTPGARFAFRINVVDRADMKMKILDKGKMIYNRLQELKQAGYEMDKTWVVVSRTGEKLNTTYSVDVLPPAKQMTEEEFGKIEGLALHKLEHEEEKTETDVPMFTD